MKKLFTIISLGGGRARGFTYLAFLYVFLFLACNHDNGKDVELEKIVLSPPTGITAVATKNVGELELKKNIAYPFKQKLKLHILIQLFHQL